MNELFSTSSKEGSHWKILYIILISTPRDTNSEGQEWDTSCQLSVWGQTPSSHCWNTNLKGLQLPSNLRMVLCRTAHGLQHRAASHRMLSSKRQDYFFWQLLLWLPSWQPERLSSTTLDLEHATYWEATGEDNLPISQDRRGSNFQNNFHSPHSSFPWKATLGAGSVTCKGSRSFVLAPAETNSPGNTHRVVHTQEFQSQRKGGAAAHLPPFSFLSPLG